MQEQVDGKGKHGGPQPLPVQKQVYSISMFTMITDLNSRRLKPLEQRESCKGSLGCKFLHARFQFAYVDVSGFPPGIRNMRVCSKAPS